MESNVSCSDFKNLLKQIVFCKTNFHMPLGLEITSAFKVLKITAFLSKIQLIVYPSISHSDNLKFVFS